MLEARHEEFCQRLAAAYRADPARMVLVREYRAVYPQSSYAAARRSASRLVARPAIRARLAELGVLLDGPPDAEPAPQFASAVSGADRVLGALAALLHAPRVAWTPGLTDGRELRALDDLRSNAVGLHVFRQPDPGAYETRVRTLAASLAGIGQQTPVLIRPDGTLVCGERRMRAARQLGWSQVWVEIRSFSSADGEFREMVRSNVAGDSLTLDHRLAIYRRRFPELFQQVSEDRLREIAAWTTIPLEQVRADLRLLVEPPAELTLVAVERAWREGRGLLGVRMERLRGDDVWRLTIYSERRPDHALWTSDPGPYVSVLRAAYKRGRSRHFRGQARAPESVLAGEELRRARETAGLDQRGAAARLDLSVSRLCELEHGRASVELITAYIDRVRRMSSGSVPVGRRSSLAP